MTKPKPTKVTKEDIELADELGRVGTIKSLLDAFGAMLTEQFAGLADVSYRGNPVATHYAILDAQDVLETASVTLQAELLRTLCQVEEGDVEVLTGVDDIVEIGDPADIDAQIVEEEKE
jgi:hypothetical protein